MRTFMYLLVAAVAAASIALWVAWQRSPERAVLLRDQEIARLRQTIAEEQAAMIRSRADCLADTREFGPGVGKASCEAHQQLAQLSRELIAKAAARLAELEREP